jgi:hypothetical protein
MSEDTKDQTETESPEQKPEVGVSAAEQKPEAAAAAPEPKPDAEPKTSVQDAGAGEPTKDEAKADDDDDAVLDATGRERPRFLLGFPEDPDLTRLSRAFEAGNYALVREEAEALAERTESPAVRAAALELRRRIDPDPLAKYLLALTAALLLSLAYFAYHH